MGSGVGEAWAIRSTASAVEAKKKKAVRIGGISDESPSYADGGFFWAGLGSRKALMCFIMESHHLGL